MCDYRWFCSLFPNHRHDDGPLTAAAGYAAKWERDLHAAGMAHVVNCPDLTVPEPNYSVSSRVNRLLQVHCMDFTGQFSSTWMVPVRRCSRRNDAASGASLFISGTRFGKPLVFVRSHATNRMSLIDCVNRMDCAWANPRNCRAAASLMCLPTI